MGHIVKKKKEIPGFASLICLILAVIPFTAPFASGTSVPLSSVERLESVEAIVEGSIRRGEIPGAVVLIGRGNEVLYHKAFGSRSLVPEALPMTTDTIFDVASLTKVVATTTAVMQLAGKGRLRLDDPVAGYWPEFAKKGKGKITLRHLLTHSSGLRPDLRPRPKWAGYREAVKRIANEKPLRPPGECFTYGDLNFIILGELVERVSGKSLDRYCSENIFGPLGMKETFFNPPETFFVRIAPTEYENGNKGELLRGKVHDPTARKMGGVAGHAGLFATAHDLSAFARMILNQGNLDGSHILSAASVEAMTTPRSRSGLKGARGLGWDIASPFAVNGGRLLSERSFGHSGYTGTSIWIDPVSGIYVIVLTNRVHPDGKGDAKPLRKEIAKLVSDLFIIQTSKKAPAARILTGADVLRSEDFAALKGMRIGLITNHSGSDLTGMSTIALLSGAGGVRLAALFSPEHGLSGHDNGRVFSSVDPLTGLPVHSLYGEVKRPTVEMLDGLDALVFDIQDAGARFYTYITTMAYAMEEAVKRGIPFYVLDRPNPLNGSAVQGPVLEDDLKSFTGYFPLPVRHGMTVGELALLFNHENRIGADVRVVRMKGYRRTYWFDDTELNWTSPSPNLRSLTGAVLYPGVALAEGANVSVGRGTGTPFELLGAPWIDAEILAAFLNKRKIPGVRFSPVNFVPEKDRFEDKECHGIRIVITDRNALDSPALGIELISALFKLYPEEFEIDRTLPLVGSREVLRAIKEGKDPNSIAPLYQERIEEFKKLRSKYLIYD